MTTQATIQENAQQFVESFLETLKQKQASDDALAPFVEDLSSVTASPTGNEAGSLEHPLMAALDAALDGANGSPALMESVAALATSGGWYQIYSGGGINATMADFMLARHIVGPKGVLNHDTIRAGIFMLAPNFEYLMHDHKALEIYYIHSGIIDVQNGVDAEPRTLGPGEYSVTPSEVPHALKTGDAPVLILFIWTGDTAAPIWWWVEGEDGTWTKEIAKKP
jgi:mannose-6-phosphate isomerase-like protein (cupin superfamily)